MNSPTLYKLKIILGLILISILLLTSTTLHARVGETNEECDARYGDSIFSHQEGDKEYRSYNFKGKRIQVVFLKSRSTMEVVLIGPQRIRGVKQATSFSVDSVTFFRGLLSDAYNFTEAQIKELNPVNQITENRATSSRATNGEIRSSFSIKTSDLQDSIQFQGVILKIVEDLILQSINDFYVKASILEGSQQEKTKASGF